jgi:hypothetical protein
MPSISTGDIIRVATRLLWNGSSDIINVWWTEILDDNSNAFGAVIQDLLEYMELLYGGIESVLANNVSFSDVAMQNFTNEENYGTYPWPTLTTGGGASDAVHPGQGVYAWAPTYVPRATGRKWFAPFTEGSNSDGVWSPSLVSTIAGLMGAAYSSYPGLNGTLMVNRVPHFIEEGEELETPQFLAPYTTVVTNVPGYQRRRRLGTGS